MMQYRYTEIKTSSFNQGSPGHPECISKSQQVLVCEGLRQSLKLEEENEEKEKEKEEKTTHIKSNNPHLTGGDKTLGHPLHVQKKYMLELCWNNIYLRGTKHQIKRLPR